MSKEFSPGKALLALREAQRLVGEYEVLTGRRFSDDDDLYWQLMDKADREELRKATAGQAMIDVYKAGVVVPFLDDKSVEYAYADYQERLSAALEQAGLIEEDVQS